MQFLFIFQFLCFKSIFFESFTWVIIHLNFMGFPFRTSKLKNDINYIKYKFSHRFERVCMWLNMYYSNIRIITFKKITHMSIWIILKNFVWTYRECNFCWYWDIWSCIHPWDPNHFSIHVVALHWCKSLQSPKGTNSIINHEVDYYSVCYY